MTNLSLETRLFDETLRLPIILAPVGLTGMYARRGEVQAAKAAASRAGREVTASAIQAHGGIGFTWEADVHWFYKRAQLDAQYLGGASEHRARAVRLRAQSEVAA